MRPHTHLTYLGSRAGTVGGSMSTSLRTRRARQQQVSSKEIGGERQSGQSTHDAELEATAVADVDAEEGGPALCASEQKGRRDGVNSQIRKDVQVLPAYGRESARPRLYAQRPREAHQSSRDVSGVM